MKVTVYAPMCKLTRDSFPRYTLTHGYGHVERKAVPLRGIERLLMKN